jgi:hypothetical protein
MRKRSRLQDDDRVFCPPPCCSSVMKSLLFREKKLLFYAHLRVLDSNFASISHTGLFRFSRLLSTPKNRKEPKQPNLMQIFHLAVSSVLQLSKEFQFLGTRQEYWFCFRSSWSEDDRINIFGHRSEKEHSFLHLPHLHVFFFTFQWNVKTRSGPADKSPIFRLLHSNLGYLSDKTGLRSKFDPIFENLSDSSSEPALST